MDHTNVLMTLCIDHDDTHSTSQCIFVNTYSTIWIINQQLLFVNKQMNLKIEMWLMYVILETLSLLVQIIYCMYVLTIFNCVKDLENYEQIYLNDQSNGHWYLFTQ